MAENPWYSHYIGDYQQKTSHLSLAEHGAYRLLLDHYYGTEHPLPVEKAILYRICRVSDRKERQIVDRIIAQFFIQIGEYYCNERCDFEIAKRLKLSNVNSANASKRHSKSHSKSQEIRSDLACETSAKAHACARASTTTTVIDKEERKKDSKTVEIDKSISVSVPKPDFVLEPSSSEAKPKKAKPPPDLNARYSDGFEELWRTYPRTAGSKFRAYEIYDKLIKGGISHETLVRGAATYGAFVASEGTEQRYVKHPATWLNARGWESDYTVVERIGAKPNGHDARRQPSKDDRMRAAVERAAKAGGYFDDDPAGAQRTDREAVS